MRFSARPPLGLGSHLAPGGLGFCGQAIDASPFGRMGGGLEAAQARCAVTMAWSHARTKQALVDRLSSDIVVERRQEAAERLGSISKVDDADAVAALALALDDSGPDVRLTAAEALGRLAERGVVGAADVLAASRDLHTDPSVRFAAVWVHGRLAGSTDATSSGRRGSAGEGDAAGVGALASSLADSDPRVRAQAVAMVPHVATTGDLAAIRSAGALIGDAEPAVRQAALDTLRKLSGVASGKDGTSPLECQAAAEASSVAVEGAASHLTADGDAGVCEQAVEALRHLAGVGDPLASAALVEGLGHGSGKVRVACVECLGSLRAKDDHVAASALVARLEDPESAVRAVAVDAVVQAAGSGDPIALSAVVSHANGSSKGNEGLGPSLDGAIERVLPSLRATADREGFRGGAAPARRRSASKEVISVGIWPVMAQLKLVDWRARAAAAQILGVTIGAIGEAASIALAAATLKDTDRHWRNRLAVEAASKTLGAAFGPHPHSTAGLCVLAELAIETDPRVSQKAAGALRSVADRGRGLDLHVQAVPGQWKPQQFGSLAPP